MRSLKAPTPPPQEKKTLQFIDLIPVLFFSQGQMNYHKGMVVFRRKINRALKQALR